MCANISGPRPFAYIGSARGLVRDMWFDLHRPATNVGGCGRDIKPDKNFGFCNRLYYSVIVTMKLASVNCSAILLIMAHKKYITPEQIAERDAKKLAYSKARYWAKREEILAKQRETLASMTDEEHEKHRTYFNQYMATYRVDNAERLRQTSKESRDRNKEERNKRAREKHAANPDVKRNRDKKWRKNNPEKVRAKTTANRLNRRIKGCKRLKPSEVLAVKEKAGGICYYCDCANPTDVEHMLPVCRGGTNDLSNLVMSCHRCNARKGKMTAEEFFVSIGKEPK